MDDNRREDVCICGHIRGDHIPAYDCGMRYDGECNECSKCSQFTLDKEKVPK